jgi:hypothetical protein
MKGLSAPPSHCNITYNSQDRKTTCPSMDEGIKKTWNLFSLKDKEIFVSKRYP